MCDRYHRDSSKEWKLYVSAIFDCYDLGVLGLSMSDNMKTELCTSTLLYGRYDTKQMTIEELKTLIWRYFIIYWNNRRICSANGGLPPMIKRKKYYESLGQVA